MATVTPNFNWPVPTSTDLVKDGATAIEALGDSIDGAFVDLKGGTTGQVLAKATNTDLDFAWVAQDDSNAIQNSIVNAKGDLIGASANDTPAILSVGANGETLVADSSTSTGLRYQGTYEAGSNFLINGGMDIWQRGTTLSFGAFDPRYLADRWLFFVGTANNTISQETTTVPAGARFAYKYTSTGAGGTFGVSQAIETANTIPLTGKNVTFQVQVTGTTGKNVNLIIESSTVVDQTNISINTVIASSATVSLTSGTFSTLTLTAFIPTTVKTLKVTVTSNSTFANTENIIFGNCKLEIGSVATAFTRAGGSIQGETSACQRYFSTSSSNGFVGIASSASKVVLISNNGVDFRVSPTITLPTPYTNYVNEIGISFRTPTTVTSVNISKQTLVDCTGMSGITTGNACSYNGSTPITMSAEL